MTLSETPEIKRCKSPNKDGSVCTVPPDLLMEAEDGTWWCWNHHPDYEAERALARSRGGLHVARKHANQPRFLDTHDLGDLKTPADALRWSQVIAGSVVTGKLSFNAASVALKALESWHRAHEAVDLTTRLEELEARVAHQQHQRDAEQQRRDRVHPPYLTRDSK